MVKEHTMKKIFIITLLFCAATGFTQMNTMPHFEIPTARSSGMGGTHVAYTDNVFSLLVNPAAMMRVEQQSIIALSPALFNPETISGFVSLMRPVLTSSNDQSEMRKAIGKAANIISEENGKLYLGMDVREFPLSIAWVSNGLGFGIWDRIYVNPNVIGTTLVLEACIDLITPVGVAFKILDTGHHNVDAGIVIKPFLRAMASERMAILSMIIDEDSFDFSVPMLIGAGFDIGFMYRWKLGLSAGLTFSDIGNTTGKIVKDFTSDASGSYKVPFSLNWGVAYDFRVGNFWETAPDFLKNFGVTAAFDWKDFNNAFKQDDYTRKNAALGIGAGIQLAMGKNDLFKFRVGMNECLPSFGFGLDIGSLEMDFAYYGKELGREPGQMSVAVLELTFAVRPQVKKHKWPWTRNSVVGLITGLVGNEENEPLEVAEEDEEAPSGTVFETYQFDEEEGVFF